MLFRSRSYPLINAQSVYRVNARIVKRAAQTQAVANSTASPFWKRLTAALTRARWPVSQNGIATKLNMSQGSVRRWYTGDGYPEIKTLMLICEKTDVTVDWLLLGRGDMRPQVRDPQFDELVEIWDLLAPKARENVLSNAKGQLAMQFTQPGRKDERDSRAKRDQSG